MTRTPRPLSVTLLASLYIGVGAIGFVFHFKEPDAIWAEPVELLAILSGVFMLQGTNWARRLAIAWMAFHVVLSASHNLGEFAIHAAFCAAIVWLLVRPAAVDYFRGDRNVTESIRLR